MSYIPEPHSHSKKSMLMLFTLLILVTQFKKTEYDAKIKDIEHKIIDHSVYITTNTFNKFSDVLFDESLKQQKK